MDGTGIPAAQAGQDPSMWPTLWAAVTEHALTDVATPPSPLGAAVTGVAGLACWWDAER